MGRLMARLLLRRLATGPGATRDELAPVVTAARLMVRESGMSRGSTPRAQPAARYVRIADCGYRSTPWGRKRRSKR